MCRPPLSLGHLTALEKLTVRGATNCDWYTRDFFEQLGRADAKPALPASLQVLRLGETAYGLCPFLWGTNYFYPWPQAPASVTIPVLELQAKGMLLMFDGSSTS